MRGRDGMNAVSTVFVFGPAGRMQGAGSGVLVLFELAFEGLEAEVDSFFEGVGDFGGHEFALREGDFHHGFLIHGGFGFHYGEFRVECGL